MVSLLARILLTGGVLPKAHAPARPAVDNSVDSTALTGLSALRSRMANGHVPRDSVFDHYLSPASKRRAATFWTPLKVCARAAAWFDELGVETVCDIGSGAGKFCVATALFGRASFIGVEQRARLVAEARCLAELFGVSRRVSFEPIVFDDLEALPTPDAYYFFNPFGENVFRDESVLDHDVELSCARFVRDVERAYLLLERAGLGTHVLTYNGYGGSMPLSFVRLREDPWQRNELILWKKVR